MPTGYTCDVQDGKITELRDFALLCARAFGIAVTMRDEPLSTPFPEEFVPDTKYYEERLAEQSKELQALLNYSEEDKISSEKAEWEDIIAKHRIWNKNKEDYKTRYSAMISKVEKWNPPPELTELKTFMLSQLHDSIDFDCSPYDAPKRPSSPQEWYNNKMGVVTRSIKYSQEQIDRELKRVAERNRVLRALRESLDEQS